MTCAIEEPQVRFSGLNEQKTEHEIDERSFISQALLMCTAL